MCVRQARECLDVCVRKTEQCLDCRSPCSTSMPTHIQHHDTKTQRHLPDKTTQDDVCVRETREKFVSRTPSSTSSQPPPHIQHHDTKTPKHKQDSTTQQHVCPTCPSFCVSCVCALCMCLCLMTCMSFYVVCVCALCLSFFHIIPPLHHICNTTTPKQIQQSTWAREKALQYVAVCCSMLQCLAVC